MFQSMESQRVKRDSVTEQQQLQGIFLTQGLDPHLLNLLPWQQILFHRATWEDKTEDSDVSESLERTEEWLKSGLIEHSRMTLQS